MKKILFILLLFPLPLFATNYYVKNGGSDSNTGLSDGQAWASLTKITAFNFSAGDTIFFRRGDTFRGFLTIHNNGSSGHPIVFDAYGTGNKPRIWGSKDFSLASLWQIYSGNVWVTKIETTTAGDVANLIFNNEQYYGWKYTSLGALSHQGDWYINPSDNMVYLYSTINPGTYYTHIEIGGAYIGTTQENINIDGANYITIRNLDVRYSPNNGIIFYSCQHGLVEYCDVSWIGGMYVPSEYPTRMGNGIGIWEDASDITIRYNKVNQCYDAGISPQGGTGYSQTNIQIYYNQITNCYYSYEWFTRATNTFTNVNFYNNTCVNSGSQWSQGQRPSSGNAEHIRNTEAGPMSITGCNIKNNIFCTSAVRGAELGLTHAQIDCNYNLWFVNVMGNTDTGGPYTTLAQWRTATSHDLNSLSVNPGFVLSTDYHLSSNSPAINAGVSVSLTKDLDGNAIVGNPDIGCYEYTSGVSLPTVTTSSFTTTTTTATGGGNVSGTSVTGRGVCYGLTANPTMSCSYTSDGTGTGSFTSLITGLSPSTTYHVRAYATNSAGVGYGGDVIATTSSIGVVFVRNIVGTDTTFVKNGQNFVKK